MKLAAPGRTGCAGMVGNGAVGVPPGARERLNTDEERTSSSVSGGGGVAIVDGWMGERSRRRWVLLLLFLCLVFVVAKTFFTF